MKIFAPGRRNPYQSKLLLSWRKNINKFRRLVTGSFSSLTPNVPDYTLIQERDLADTLFERLKESLYRPYEQGAEEGGFEGGGYFWEAGRIDPGRLYFYLKKANEKGWLFERSGIGWLVSRSEKIIDQSLFLRLEEPVDIVTTFRAEPDSGRYKINSELMGGELISFVVYERLMVRKIFSD